MKREVSVEIVIPPKSEPFPSLDQNGDEDIAHIVQVGRGHVHALCGVVLDMKTLGEADDSPDCPVCVSIAKNWLRGAGWDGFGQPPGKKRRKEIEELL